MIPLDQAAGQSFLVYSNACKPMLEAPTHRQMHKHAHTHTHRCHSNVSLGTGENKHPRIIYSGHCFIGGGGTCAGGRQKQRRAEFRPGSLLRVGGSQKQNRAEFVNICCAGREGHGHRQLHKHMYQHGQAHEEKNGHAHPHEHTLEHTPE